MSFDSKLGSSGSCVRKIFALRTPIQNLLQQVRADKCYDTQTEKDFFNIIILSGIVAHFAS